MHCGYLLQKTKLILILCICYMLVTWQRCLYRERDVKSLATNAPLVDMNQEYFQNVAEKRVTTIHMGAVSYGERYAKKVLVAIKFILLLTDTNLQWYVFTTDNTTNIITADIHLWPDAFRSRVTVIEVPLTCDKWKAYYNSSRDLRGMSIKQCVFTGIEHCGIKNYTDRFIFIDLDTYIVDDMKHLWNLFSIFTDDQIMAVARADARYILLEYTQHTYDKRYGINSGVVLIHLAHMSGFNFDDKYIYASRQKFYYKNNNTKDIDSKDDQNVLNILFYQYPHKILPLGCNWNYRGSMDGKCVPGDRANCDEAIPQGVSLIHAYADSKFFLRTHYAAVYNCTQTLDLHQVENTIRCLHNGILWFQKKRSQTCDMQVNHLRPLQTALRKYHPNK